jgi:hypothetical protein
MALVVFNGVQFDDKHLPRHVDPSKCVPLAEWFASHRLDVEPVEVEPVGAVEPVEVVEPVEAVEPVEPVEVEPVEAAQSGRRGRRSEG